MTQPIPPSVTQDPLERLTDLVHQDHLVGFYDSDAYLTQSLVHFVASGLAADELVLVIATSEHCQELEQALEVAGFAVADLRASHRLRFLDAARLLPQILADGQPVGQLLLDQALTVIDDAATHGQRIRVYGEMAALLWKEGNIPGVLALERFSAELVAKHPITLFCAYPLRAFDREDSAEAFHLVCDAHSAVLPSEFYAELADADQRHRAVAILQHEAIVGINERIALREALHRQSREQKRLSALDKVRARLVAALVGEDAADSPEASPRTRSSAAVDAVGKTACRQVRAVLGAAACSFARNALDDLGQGEAPAVNDGPIVAVDVSDVHTTYGVLRVKLTAERTLDDDDRAFLREIARTLAAACAHAAR